MTRDGSSDRVADIMREDSRSNRDQLEKLRRALSDYRDESLKIRDLEDGLEQAKQRRSSIERQVLPDLFAEAGVSRVDVPADGNLPEAEAVLSDFYKAVIQAKWDEAKKDRAFRVLEERGLDDLIKSVVSVEFGRRESNHARGLMERLQEMGLRPTLQRSVHHAALTSALKEIYDQGERLSQEDLDAIGAAVGKIVRVRFK